MTLNLNKHRTTDKGKQNCTRLSD